MRDVIQITMPRRAAIAINNLAGLGYYVACINAGAPVDAGVLRYALANAINAIRANVPGNATQAEMQEAFRAFGLVPAQPGDNVSGEAVTTTRDGFEPPDGP